MSMVAGDLGSKSVFPDGIQVDHISENTVGHGVRVRGISDPTTYPVLAGDVGEIFGTATAGVGGSGYSTITTTTLTNTIAAVATLTLNRGVYLVSAASRHYVLSGTSQLSGELWVGGTRVTPLDLVVNYITSTTSGTVNIVMPVVITSDGTAVAIAAKISTGTDGGGYNAISAVRIA